MRNSRFALLLALAPLAAFAVDPTQAVSVGKIAPVRLEAGKTADVEIPVVVAAGYHVQANPASNPQLIPTKIEFTESKAVKPGEPVYPPGNPYRLKGTGADLATYAGKLSIRVPVTALEGAKGKHSLAGKIRYQACNDKICFFPSAAAVAIPVVIVK